MGKNKKINAWLNLIDGSLSENDTVELPVLTGSMMPVLVPGKSIKIKRAGYGDVRAGDIVIFKETAGLTAHRVLLRLYLPGMRFLYQKGDMNRFGYWISGGAVLGMVTEVQDNSGAYVDIASLKANRNKRRIVFKQILFLLLNFILIIPRKTREWTGKIIKKNSV